MTCFRPCAFLCVLYWMFGSFLGYGVGVGTNSWVTAGNQTWGLWSWCVVNGAKAIGCHAISPGDSPGYFEGVRTVAVVTALLEWIFVVSLCVFSHTRGPALVTILLYTVSAATTIALMITNYTTDERWRDSNPRLGWSFWLACGSAGLSFFFCLIIAIARPNKNTPPSPPSPDSQRCPLWCCGPDPSLPTVTRRPSNASSLSIDTGKRITIFHSQTSNLSSIDTGRSNPAFETSGLSHNTRALLQGEVFSVPRGLSTNQREVVNDRRDRSTNSRDIPSVQRDSSTYSSNILSAQRRLSTNPRDVSGVPSHLTTISPDYASMSRDFTGIPRDVTSIPRDVTNMARGAREGTRLAASGRSPFPVFRIPRVSPSSSQ